MSKRTGAFSKTFTVLALTASGAAMADLSPMEIQAVSDMAGRGVSKFLLLNKETGHLKIVENGEESASFPALSGKFKGDAARKNLYVTPSGIFPLLPEDDEHQPYPAVSYLKDGKVSYVIHPVSGRRSPLLRSGAESKRATAGCINVDRKTFREVWNFATSSPEVLQDEGGTPVVSANFLVVLPELKK